MKKSEFMELEKEARVGLEQTPNDLLFVVCSRSMFISYHGFSKKHFSFNSKKQDVINWVNYYKNNNFLR